MKFYSIGEPLRERSRQFLACPLCEHRLRDVVIGTTEEPVFRRIIGNQPVTMMLTESHNGVQRGV